MYTGKEFMDPRKKAIVIGALLHDIGKVGQRAQRKEELSKDALNRESDICPGEGFSTHLHVLWTDEFFNICFLDELKSKLIGEVSFDFNFNPQNLASFHHKPASYPHKLIQIADRISSGEREETERGEREDYIKRKLSSIFNKVSLKHEADISKREPYFYDLTPLDLNRSVFPKKKSELDAIYGIQKTEKHREKYKLLWEGFIKDFKELRDTTIKYDIGFDLFLSALYHLLMKYTWCIPSYTNAKEEVDNDISLFDHSRTTAAIASCLFDIYGEGELPEDTTESEFIVVEGDISGIQSFIYRLAQPSGIEGVGRILRGRSMFLTLLPIVTANYIARELNQTFVNVLYAGGGNFQILLPNKEETINKLKHLSNNIDKWLFDNFKGELGLVIGYVKATRQDLGKGYGEVIHKLKIEVENQKSKKFFERFFEEQKFVIKQKENLCKVCGSLDAKTKEDLCTLCDEHRRLGSDIPKCEYLALSDCNRQFKEGIEVDFGMLGKAWFLKEQLHYNQINDTYSYLKVNSTESYLGFKFLGNIVPKAKEEITLGKGKEETQYDPGKLISFDHLGLLAEGDKKLGVLRMDVDYLGLIFSIGLSKTDKEGKIQGLSISRAAMLSRMLEWFFTGYLNTLCKTTSDELCNAPLESEIKVQRSKVDCHYYIVYSGGDDLFIVAPWDEALELAFRIRDDFKEFSGYNPDIDISGGFLIVKPKFPISRSGRLAGEELEEKAKKERGSLAALGESGKWEEVKRNLELGELLVKAVNGFNGKKLPRSFLNRVLEIRSKVLELNEGDPKGFLFVPEIVYSITRNIDNKLKIPWKGSTIWIKEKLNQELLGSKDGLRRCGFAIKYALLKTRRRL